jgi:transposase
VGWTVNTSQLLIRYNEEGLAGRSDRPHGDGPSAKLTDDEKAQLAGWVRQGPDLQDDGVGGWRLSDLKQRILARFFVVMDERSRMLKTLSFSHILGSAANPKADAETQETH